MRLREKIRRILMDCPGVPLTARQIAEKVVELYKPEAMRKKERSAKVRTEEQLIQQIVAEISANHKWQLMDMHPQLTVTTDTQPEKYCWSEKADEADWPGFEDSGEAENGLFGMLENYLRHEFGVHSRRVNAKSWNEGQERQNSWTYPDMVGMQDAAASWSDDIRGLAETCGYQKTRLWSLAIRSSLGRYGAREAFFQTVSNCSWANMAYLAAAEIEADEVRSELDILAGQHGVGLIEVNAGSPDRSRVLIPARARSEVDWDACERMAEGNPDFLEAVRRAHKSL